MAFPLYTPRLNNNDDFVKVSHIFVTTGAHVHAGEEVAELETDKATFTVEAEQEGYLLRFNAQKGDSVAVGSILAWFGSNSSDSIPASEVAQPVQLSRQTRPASLKAALLMADYQIDAANVIRAGDRIEVADVERHVRSLGLSPILGKTKTGADIDRVPSETGRRCALNAEEHGMLRTVAWHHSQAVPGYVEIAYEEAPWNTYADAFQKKHSLLLDPLLSLLAWRLVSITKENPQINATVVASEKYVYDHVNLGFTVQSGRNLYVITVREAEILSQREFVDRLAELQRAAIKKKLRPRDVEGATLTFSSMARWGVTRHMPVLVPHTSIIVAHSTGRDKIAHLGATYDHRVLTGGEVASILLTLSRPEEV